MKRAIWIQKRKEAEDSKLIVDDGTVYKESDASYASKFDEFINHIGNVKWDYDKNGTKIALNKDKSVIVAAHFEETDWLGRKTVFTHFQTDERNVIGNILGISGHTLCDEKKNLIENQIKTLISKRAKKQLILIIISLIGCTAIATGLITFFSRNN